MLFCLPVTEEKCWQSGAITATATAGELQRCLHALDAVVQRGGHVVPPGPTAKINAEGEFIQPLSAQRFNDLIDPAGYCSIRYYHTAECRLTGCH